jgi:ABC-type metal ion transport system substrate-binding protein
MLDISFRKKENGIEEVVYDFLKDCTLVELTQETTETFLMIGMMPKNLKLKTEDTPFLVQVMEKRIEHCFTFKVIDERVLLALSIWAESAGSAIIYLWYVQGWCFKNKVKEVDFEIFSTRIFPMGIFSEKDLKSVWEKQKVQKNGMESDNLIDYAVAGLSIQFLN